MRAGLVALLEYLDYDSATARLLVVASLAAGPTALERRQDVLRTLNSVIDRGRTRRSATGSVRASGGEPKAIDDPPALTAEGIVGGVVSVLHARLTENTPTSLLELTSPLMGMIVLPYLGPAAARKETTQPAPSPPAKRAVIRTDPLQDLPMRFTYRTMRVLAAVATQPGSSNRAIGEHAGIPDQGQASKLLARLHRLDLIENRGGDPARGEPNAWILTTTGTQVHDSIAGLGG